MQPAQALIDCIIRNMSANGAINAIYNYAAQAFKILEKAAVDQAKAPGCTFTPPLRKDDAIDDLIDLVSVYFDPYKNRCAPYKAALSRCGVQINPDPKREKKLREHVIKKIVGDNWATIEQISMAT